MTGTPQPKISLSPHQVRSSAIARCIRAARDSLALPNVAAPYKKSSFTNSKPQSFNTRSNTVCR